MTRAEYPKRRIRWEYLGSPAAPGVWKSRDGRFDIYPEYMGTTRPQGYRLHDGSHRSTHDTVALAKRAAEERAGAK